MFYLIHFAKEGKYSVVEGKTIQDDNPKVNDTVHVKDKCGLWEGIIVYKGKTLLSKARLTVDFLFMVTLS